MSFKQTLGGMEPQEFLRDYWQKKPLLIRQAFPGFKTLVQPNELAGLACEDEVESRLVLEKDGQVPWELRHGPFGEGDFQALPNSHWTLLVQGVDLLLPEVGALKEKFRFIPDWRIDDVMISYAVDQGSVGPHVDNYDVFLLQGLGKRRWQLGADAIVDEEVLEGCDLRVLTSFEADQTFDLEPGDILYVPPRFAHFGAALGECMTYSIGFRSPSHADLLAAYAGQHIAGLDEKDRFTDPNLTLQANPAEISSQAIAHVVEWLKSMTPDAAQVQHWFGKLVTAQGACVEPIAADKTLSQNRKNADLVRNEGTRIAFIDAASEILLFVNGEEYILPKAAKEFVSVITKDFRISRSQLAPFLGEYGSFVDEMITMGAFYFES